MQVTPNYLEALGYLPKLFSWQDAEQSLGHIITKKLSPAKLYS